MQLNNGELYWRQKSKIHKTYPYLTRDINCDVLIIGGGISGALTGYFLANEGANIVIAEKNILGYGSTISSTALLDYQTDIDFCKLEKMIGTIATKRVYKLCHDAISKFEKINKKLKSNTEFMIQDNIYFTNKFMQKGIMAKEYETRKKAGFNTSYIDSHNLVNLNSAILTKKSGAVLNPYQFTQSLFDYLDKFDNVKIFENTKIEDIKCLADANECYTNNNFKITADKIIFASGVETLKRIPNLPVELNRAFTLVSEPIPELKKYTINFIAKDNLEPQHYFRFTSNNRIICGGESVKLTGKYMDSKYLNSISNDKYKKLFNFMNKTLYNLDEIPIEFAFNSVYASTKDGLPIIDEIPGMSNCFCNLGFGTNGIIYSLIGADMLKDAIKGFYTKDMNIFKINRNI